MSVRPEARRTQIQLVVLSLLVLGVLTLMVVAFPARLDDFDRSLGTWPYELTAGEPRLRRVLLAVQAAFGTLALTIATVITAVLLATRGHPRAAYWTVGVMLGAALTTTALKTTIGRERPEWDDPLATLESYSFPSGHASGTASAMGVGIVLTMMLVRRRGLRRGLVGLFLGLVVLVGLDRILLGVHNVSDVLAGYAVGAAWVLGGLLVFSPAPASLADTAPPMADASHRPRRRLHVVLNPVKVESIEEFQRIVTRAAGEAGWAPPRWHYTTVEDPGRSMAEKAAVSGADMVLVCGGDGTVRTVCAELAGTGIPVGIVPAGTGNLLARNLDIPLYLPAAVDVALHGQDLAIDLVRVGGDGIPDDAVFLVMAGLGFDAMIMEGVNEEIKARVGWIAYVLSALKSLMFPAASIEMSIDGGEFTKHRARTIVLGNVGYLQAGMPLIPQAAIDDGMLDIVLINPRRFLHWLLVAARVLSKGKRVDDTVNRFTCRRVEIRAAHDVPRQLDGDSVGPGRELWAECQHGRLLVRGPR